MTREQYLQTWKQCARCRVQRGCEAQPLAKGSNSGNSHIITAQKASDCRRQWFKDSFSHLIFLSQPPKLVLTSVQKKIWFCSDWATLLLHLTGCFSTDVRVKGFVWRYITAKVALVALHALKLSLNGIISPRTDKQMRLLLIVFYCNCLFHYITAPHLRLRSLVWNIGSLRHIEWCHG